MNVTVKTSETNNFVWLEYALFLERNSAFYVNHLIFPFALLAGLSNQRKICFCQRSLQYKNIEYFYMSIVLVVSDIS